MDYFLLFSVFFLYFFQLFLKDFKLLLFLNSNESFLVFFIGIGFSNFDLILVFFYYFFLFLIIWSDLEDFFDIEKVFFIMAIPLSGVFFVKRIVIFFYIEKSFLYGLCFFLSFINALGQLYFLVFLLNNNFFISSSILLFLFYFFLVVFLLVYYIFLLY